MVIVLVGVSVTLVPKTVAETSLFIGNLPSMDKNWKVTNAVRKKCLDFVLVSLKGCITMGGFTSVEFFYFLKYIINTNIWKLKRSQTD